MEDETERFILANVHKKLFLGNLDLLRRTNSDGTQSCLFSPPQIRLLQVNNHSLHELTKERWQQQIKNPAAQEEWKLHIEQVYEFLREIVCIAANRFESFIWRQQ